MKEGSWAEVRSEPVNEIEFLDPFERLLRLVDTKRLDPTTVDFRPNLGLPAG
jgi:hypothetical protein